MDDPNRDDVLLFLRSASVITAMIATDVKEGTYCQGGRPNFTTLQVFIAIMIGAYVGPNEQMAKDTGYGGGVKEMRKVAAELLEIVRRIPIEKGREPAFKVGANNELIPCVTASERDRLLEILGKATNSN